MKAEDWNKVKERWSNPYATIKIEADGYAVTLNPVIHRMKLVRMLYINGRMKGEWYNTDCEERRRFFRTEQKFVLSPKLRSNAKKHLSKKIYEQFEIDKKITQHFGWWVSFNQFKKHIKNNNNEIKLIENEY